MDGLTTMTDYYAIISLIFGQFGSIFMMTLQHWDGMGMGVSMFGWLYVSGFRKYGRAGVDDDVFDWVLHICA